MASRGASSSASVNCDGNVVSAGSDDVVAGAVLVIRVGAAAGTLEDWEPDVHPTRTLSSRAAQIFAVTRLIRP